MVFVVLVYDKRPFKRSWLTRTGFDAPGLDSNSCPASLLVHTPDPDALPKNLTGTAPR